MHLIRPIHTYHRVTDSNLIGTLNEEEEEANNPQREVGREGASGCMFNLHHVRASGRILHISNFRKMILLRGQFTQPTNTDI